VLRCRNTLSDTAADRGSTGSTNSAPPVEATHATNASHAAVNGHARDESRAWEKEVRAKKKVIAWKYRQRQRQRDPDSFNKTWMGKRRFEVEDLIRYRFGVLPDTDDRDIFLRLWAWSNPYSRDPATDLRDFGLRLGVWLSDAEVEAAIRYVEGKRRKFSAKTFGRHLRLTTAEWLVLRPTTMVPFDCTPKELDRLRRDIRVERKRERRREQGAKPRAEWLATHSLSRARPWEALGYSERHWRRLGKPMSEVRDMHLTDSAGDTPRTSWKRKEPRMMKKDTSLHTLPSPGETSSDDARARTVEGAFAGPVLDDAASAYGELPMELRLMALGLTSAGSTAVRRRKAA
jgi:hypothetical protein